MYNEEALVSVIIPVYNVEKYLEQCIDSVLNQTYNNLEIILIDDCSKDESFNICQNKAQIDNRIMVLQNKENKGLSFTRNRGIIHAKGKYIYFLDSDDYVQEDLFQSIIPFMEKNNLEMCYFSAQVFIDGEGLSWNMNTYIKKGKYKIDNGKNILKSLNKNNEYSPSNCIFITKTDLITNNGITYREGIIYEDNFFAFQLAMQSKRSSVINDVFYVRRVRPGSIMTSTDKQLKKIHSCKMVMNDFDSVIGRYGKSADKYIKYILKSFSATLIDETCKLNDKSLIKESRKFLLDHKYYWDYKVFGYAILKLYLYF